MSEAAVVSTAGVSYEWRAGARVRVDANAAGAVLEELRSRTGQLLPEDVVAEASDPQHVLHGEFEWDDSVAANEHRLAQARYLVRHVVVVGDPIEPKPHRAFVVITPEVGRDVYQSTHVAMSNAGMRAQVVARARKELRGWRERYRELHELGQVFQAVDELLDGKE